MTDLDILRAFLWVSTICYGALLLSIVRIHDGPAWTMFKIVIACHWIGAIGSNLTAGQMTSVPAGAGFWMVCFGRLAGGIGNVALALLLHRLHRKR